MSAKLIHHTSCLFPHLKPNPFFPLPNTFHHLCDYAYKSETILPYSMFCRERGHIPKQRMRPKDWTEKRKTSTGRPYVEHVVKTTRRMNSGYAVTYARDGSMVSALRSLLLKPSTSSITNARPVRTRRPALDTYPFACF